MPLNLEHIGLIICSGGTSSGICGGLSQPRSVMVNHPNVGLMKQGYKAVKAMVNYV